MDEAGDRPVVRRRGKGRPFAAALIAVLGAFAVPSATESAIADGDTRTLSFTDGHTNESGSFTYMVNGAYDMAVLEKLNWFMRDWRLNESIKMDPKLFDILWEVYRESGSTEPIDVLSGYRSPQTNAMLRRRSRQVAEHSQHMEGRAIDAHFIDVGPAKIRDIAMRMQSGGVGFYPIGVTPWVHIDSGAVRYWPRMSRDALARLFPDGKTVFIPADGQPLPGYDLARAEIESRGGNVVPAGAVNGNGLFGGPHGGGSDDSEESSDSSMLVASAGVHGRGGIAIGGGVTQVASAKAPEPAAAGEAASGEAAAGSKVADVDANVVVAGAGEVSLRGPIAAEFIAPMPPRKPQELVTVASASAPAPPSRPKEPAAPAEAAAPTFSVASASSVPVQLPFVRVEPQPTPTPTATHEPDAASSDRDLILALLRKSGAPDVITRGLRQLPSEALALAESSEAGPPQRSEMIAKAAQLTAPLPPRRPKAITPDPALAGGSSGSDTATTSVVARNETPEPFGSLSAQTFDDGQNPSEMVISLKAKALASAD